MSETDIAVAAGAVAGAAEQLVEQAVEDAGGLTPQEAELERTIVVEEEATKRELARLETELKIAKLQAEKPAWLEEMLLQMQTQHEALLTLFTQTTLTQPPQPQAIAIAAPQETEATAPGATVETVEQEVADESADPMPAQPDPAATVADEPRRRTFSRGI